MHPASCILHLLDLHHPRATYHRNLPHFPFQGYILPWSDYFSIPLRLLFLAKMEDSKQITPGRDVDNTLGEKREYRDVELQPENGTLARALKGRHMQMIAIGV